MDTSRHRRGRRARPLAAVLVAGLLVAASCGGDDDDSSGTTPVTSGDSTAVEVTTAATTASTEATADTEATDGTEATTDTEATGATDATEPSTPGRPTTEDGFQDAAALEGADRDGTLTVAWQLTLATLDPLLNPNVQNVAYNFPSYDTLIYRNPDGELFPGLAESWEWDDAGTMLTLTIREGVTFHDGSMLDANVVKANLDRLMALTTSPVFNSVANFESVEVTDPMTVVIHVKQPDATIPYSLADRAGMMVSGQALADGVDLNLDEVGAGPYRVTEFRSGDRDLLRALRRLLGRPQRRRRARTW